MKYPNPYRSMGHGFTLVEIAIVLFIVTLLMGGLLPTMSGQIEQRRNSDTSKQLNEIKDALIGYAVMNGRLPCPASTISLGIESPTTGTGICDHNYDGYVPAATLGISGTNSSGLVVDSWGNPIHYAVTLWGSNTFTVPNGMSTKGISNLTPPDLLVCSTATGIGISSCGTNYALTSNGVPVVIFSTGKNGAQGYAAFGTDEKANLDGTNANSNRTFVSHLPTGSGAPNGYFDDIVIWISPNVLINRMVVAGKLP